MKEKELYDTVSYTTELFKLKKDIKITSPDDITPDVIDMMFKKCMYSHEEVHAMYFDHSRNLRYTERLGAGQLQACVVNEASLWTSMYVQRVSHCILIHNHPSGSESFSEADKKLAHKLDRSSLTLGVNISDFLIVTPNYKVISAKMENIL